MRKSVVTLLVYLLMVPAMAAPVVDDDLPARAVQALDSMDRRVLQALIKQDQKAFLALCTEGFPRRELPRFMQSLHPDKVGRLSPAGVWHRAERKGRVGDIVPIVTSDATFNLPMLRTSDLVSITRLKGTAIELMAVCMYSRQRW